MLLQLGLLTVICLIGQAISLVSPFPVPPSVLSMVLLFVLLLTKALKTRHIDKICGFLLNNMAFLFVPVGVDLLKYTDILGAHWWKLLLICILSAIVTFGVTGYTVQGLIWLQNRRKEGKVRD